MNPFKMAKVFQRRAKVVKFRQNWSHWTEERNTFWINLAAKQGRLDSRVVFALDLEHLYTAPYPPWDVSLRLTSVTRLGDFESSRWYDFIKSTLNILWPFGLFWGNTTLKYKLLWLLFGQLMEPFGLLLIHTSGHAAPHPSKTCFTLFHSFNWFI